MKKVFNKNFWNKKQTTNLRNKYFTQFFLDSAYRCVPNNLGFKDLLLLINRI